MTDIIEKPKKARTVEEQVLEISNHANGVLNDVIERLCAQGAKAEELTLYNMADDHKMAWRVLAHLDVAIYEVFVEKSDDALTLNLVTRPVDPADPVVERIAQSVAAERGADKPLIVTPSGETAPQVRDTCVGCGKPMKGYRRRDYLCNECRSKAIA